METTDLSIKETALQEQISEKEHSSPGYTCLLVKNIMNSTVMTRSLQCSQLWKRQTPQKQNSGSSKAS